MRCWPVEPLGKEVSYLAKYLDETGLRRLAEWLRDGLAGKQDALSGSAGQYLGFDEGGAPVPKDGMASKAYVDGLLGNIGAILDEINGEEI